MTEQEELIADLRAVYSEQHPTRIPDSKHFHDDVVTLGVLLRREIRRIKLPDLDRIARHDPKDAE